MKKSRSFSTSFKEGIFFIIPVGVTFWLINWAWNFLRNLVPSSLYKKFPDTWTSFPYFEGLFDLAFLMIVIILITFSGMIASTVIGRFMHGLTEKVLTKPTLIRPIYQTFKKVSEMIFSNKDEDDFSKNLSQSIIVPYPNADTKSIGFVTADNANIFLGPEKGKDWLTVYVPSAPLVSAGFFLLCRKDDTDICLLPSGLAMTTIISVGTNSADAQPPQIESSEQDPAPKVVSKRSILSTWFLNGIVFLTPVIGTLSILVYLFDYLYTALQSISVHFPYFSSTIPEQLQDIAFNVVLFIVIMLGIAFLGFLGESAIGYGLKRIINKIFSSIPMLNSVYEIVTKLTEMFSPNSTQENKFNQAVLVPYPTKNTYAIGFVIGNHTNHIKKSDIDDIPVFIPTTPIPTTGWFVFVDRQDVIPLNMPIEKAFALVISAGILTEE
ncbi:MAG: DUF502 domain-containing protein [Brevinema sp.]